MVAAVSCGSKGPSPEELKARQDSIQKARQDSILRVQEQARQDSIEQARQDSIAQAEAEAAEQARLEAEIKQAATSLFRRATGGAETSAVLTSAYDRRVHSELDEAIAQSGGMMEMGITRSYIPHIFWSSSFSNVKVLSTKAPFKVSVREVDDRSNIAETYIYTLVKENGEWRISNEKFVQ